MATIGMVLGMVLLSLATGTTLWWEPAAAQAAPLEPPLSDFREVRRANDIDIGLDVGGTGHEALNFSGNAGAAGDTWIAVYDPTATPGATTFQTVHLSADVLIHARNNKKGAGLLALYNEASGKKGLALTLYSAGNTDSLVLSTVNQAGQLVTLRSVSLGSAISEDAWYRIEMDVEVANGLVSVLGAVFNHAVATDPDSATTTQIGPTLDFSVAALGVGVLAGVDSSGQAGVLASAVLAANSSSVTNVVVDEPTPTLACAPPSQTVAIGQTASVSATGGTGAYSWSAPGASVPTGAGAAFGTSYAARGTYTITVTSGGQTSHCTVTVPPPA